MKKILLILLALLVSLLLPFLLGVGSALADSYSRNPSGSEIYSPVTINTQKDGGTLAYWTILIQESGGYPAHPRYRSACFTLAELHSGVEKVFNLPAANYNGVFLWGFSLIADCENNEQNPGEAWPLEGAGLLTIFTVLEGTPTPTPTPTPTLTPTPIYSRTPSGSSIYSPVDISIQRDNTESYNYFYVEIDKKGYMDYYYSACFSPSELIAGITKNFTLSPNEYVAVRLLKTTNIAHCETGNYEGRENLEYAGDSTIFTILEATPTPTPAPTPTPSPTPTPTPSETPTPSPTDTLLQSILSTLQSIGGTIDDIVSKLITIISNMAGLATENTLGLIKIKTDSLDVPLSSRASEATLSTRASESTLQAANNSLGDLGTKLSTIIGSFASLATENTLGLIKIKTDNLDVPLSTRLNALGQKTMADSAPVVIASDQTIQTNQSVTLSDKVFSVSTNIFPIADGAERALMLIKNPAGSGKKLEIFSISYTEVQISSARATFRAYANPTISADGTALTPVNFHIKSPPIASIMKFYKSPTVTAKGSLMHAREAGQSFTSNLELTNHIVLNEEQSLLITGLSNNGPDIEITVSFIEE